MTRRNPLEDLERAKTNREVNAALERAPNLRCKRTGGRHIVYVGPHGSVPATNHPGECARGTKNSIVRMAVAAGLFGLVAVVLVGLRMGGVL